MSKRQREFEEKVQAWMRILRLTRKKADELTELEAEELRWLRNAREPSDKINDEARKRLGL